MKEIVPSKIIDSEEFRIERAIDLKTRTAGHLGDVQKELNISFVDDYESAFHKCLDAHETYFPFEDDEGMVAVAKESYEKEIERKFYQQVEI